MLVSLLDLSNRRARSFSSLGLGLWWLSSGVWADLSFCTYCCTWFCVEWAAAAACVVCCLDWASAADRLATVFTVKPLDLPLPPPQAGLLPTQPDLQLACWTVAVLWLHDSRKCVACLPDSMLSSRALAVTEETSMKSLNNACKFTASLPTPVCKLICILINQRLNYLPANCADRSRYCLGCKNSVP